MHIQNQAVSILSLLSWESIWLHIEEQNRRSKGTMQCPWPKSCQAQCIYFYESATNLPNTSLTPVYIYIYTLVYAPPCRRNSYDGELEYWVVLKESGKRTEESSYEEEHTKRQKACIARFLCVLACQHIYEHTHTHSHLWYKHVLKYCMYIYIWYIYMHMHIYHTNVQ